MKDRHILDLYWRRDECAIAETVKKYGDYCCTVARNILRDPQDAEECVNDTWLRVWNAIPPQRPARLRLFLAKITRNLAFDRYKAKNAEKRGGELESILCELEECVSASATEDEVVAKELEQTVNRFVRSLPQRECSVFLRRYFLQNPQRKSHRDMA